MTVLTLRGVGFWLSRTSLVLILWMKFISHLSGTLVSDSIPNVKCYGLIPINSCEGISQPSTNGPSGLGNSLVLVLRTCIINIYIHTHRQTHQRWTKTWTPFPSLNMFVCSIVGPSFATNSKPGSSEPGQPGTSGRFLGASNARVPTREE